MLAAVPSSLLSGTTTKITTEAAAGPLFWVVPLALYLLTFALAFARRRWLPLRPMLVAQTVATALIVMSALIEAEEYGGLLIILILIALLFLCAYVCNCRLADSRPGPERTGEFYLMIALGGLIGGTFNALIAPNIFRDVIEYPLVLVLAMALQAERCARALSRHRHPPGDRRDRSAGHGAELLHGDGAGPVAAEHHFRDLALPAFAGAHAPRGGIGRGVPGRGDTEPAVSAARSRAEFLRGDQGAR